MAKNSEYGSSFCLGACNKQESKMGSTGGTLATAVAKILKRMANV